MKVWRSAACLILLVVATGSVFRAFGEPSELPAYLSRVKQAGNLLGAIQNGSRLTTREADALRDLLPPHEQVVYRGQVYEIDHRWVQDSIRKVQGGSSTHEQQEAFLALKGSISDLAHQLEMAASSQTPFDPNSSRRLEQILSRREFQVKRNETLFERVMEWIMNTLRKLLSYVPQVGSNSERVLKIVILAVACLLVLYLVFLLRKHFLTERRAKKKTARIVLGEQIAANVGSSDLLREALDLRANGDYRAAIRRLYAATLIELDDRRILKLTESATNREYLRMIERSAATLRDAFLSLTDSFEFYWYGQRETREQDFEQFYGRYQQLISGQPAASGT